MLVASATADVRADAPPASSAPPGKVSAPPALDLAHYPWLAGDVSPRTPAPVESLRARFPPPPGFTRSDTREGSFARWLGGLPLAARGTPVRAFDGRELHPGSHPNVGAVVAIDVGAADLQQCADSVIRMHAEWSWDAGKSDSLSHHAAAGLALPWARWARGERIVAEGTTGIAWTTSARPASDHATFRRYLDAVFAWANTVSLAKEATQVAPAAVEAGDFVVSPGNPGHAVLVLDLATDDAGRRAVLLGQGYMPAQSFHVLVPDEGAHEATGTAWFLLDPAADGLKTPFWPTFPWSSLRRLPR